MNQSYEEHVPKPSGIFQSYQKSAKMANNCCIFDEIVIFRLILLSKSIFFIKKIAIRSGNSFYLIILDGNVLFEQILNLSKMARSRLNHFVLDWLCSIHSFTVGCQHVESIVIQSGVRNFRNHFLDIRQGREKQMTDNQSQLVSEVFQTISNLGWFQKFLKPFSKKGLCQQ